MASKLNPKQERFCLEYIVDLNATQAAIRSGYSVKSAKAIGSEHLTKPDIQARIEELKGAREKRTEITADTVLQELLLLAKVDLSRAYGDDGKLLPIKQIPEDVRRAIAGIEVFEEYEGHGKDKEYVGDTVKVKFWDKTRSLEMLGRHLKLFTDVIKHEGLENRSDEELKKRLEELEKK